MTIGIKEYKFKKWIVKTLKEDGYDVQIIMDVNSVYDVIALKVHSVRLIQAKTCKKGAEAVMKRELKAFREYRDRLPMMASLEVWVKEDRKEVLVGVV